MLKHWLLASRPKTLVASLLPVVAGFLLAYEQAPNVSKVTSILCLLYCLLIQIGTNFANDYFDFLKGADEKRENAPRRMVSSGLISPKFMLLGTCLIFLLSFMVGVYLMESVKGSRYLLVVGVASILFGLGYTGGPFPLAYNGLGDLFVVVFFGFVAVLTTQYVITLSGDSDWQPNWILPLGVGLVINNLLVVNNYRDYEEDKQVGKRTIVVLLGRPAGLALFSLSVLISTLLIPFLVPSTWPTIFLLPLGIYAFLQLRKSMKGSDFSKVLSLCAVKVLLYAFLLMLGYLM